MTRPLDCVVAAPWHVGLTVVVAWSFAVALAGGLIWLLLRGPNPPRGPASPDDEWGGRLD